MPAGSSGKPEMAAPAFTAPAAWEPALGMAVGRLASLSLGSKAEQEGEASGQASRPPVAAPAAPVETHMGPSWEEACAGAGAPVEDASACWSIPSSTPSASGIAERAGLPSAAPRLAAAGLPSAAPRLAAAGSPRGRALPCWSSDSEGGGCILAAMHDRGLRQRREAEQRCAQSRVWGWGRACP